MKILNVEVKTHNEREKHLVNIINSNINRCRDYMDHDTFGNNTQSVIKRTLLECDNLFLSLYYMDLVPYTTLKPDLEKEFKIDLY